MDIAHPLRKAWSHVSTPVESDARFRLRLMIDQEVAQQPVCVTAQKAVSPGITFSRRSTSSDSTLSYQRREGSSAPPSVRVTDDALVRDQYLLLRRNEIRSFSVGSLWMSSGHRGVPWSAK